MLPSSSQPPARRAISRGDADRVFCDADRVGAGDSRRTPQPSAGDVGAVRRTRAPRQSPSRGRHRQDRGPSRTLKLRSGSEDPLLRYAQSIDGIDACGTPRRHGARGDRHQHHHGGHDEKADRIPRGDRASRCRSLADARLPMARRAARRASCGASPRRRCSSSSSARCDAISRASSASSRRRVKCARSGRRKRLIRIGAPPTDPRVPPGESARDTPSLRPRGWRSQSTPI